MWPRVEGLRAFSFGDEGPMRQRLTDLALDGTKIATAGLLQQDYLGEGEEVDTVGERQLLRGPGDEVAAVIEVTRVEVHRFAAVPWEFSRRLPDRLQMDQCWCSRAGRGDHTRRGPREPTGPTHALEAWYRHEPLDVSVEA